MDNKKSAGLIVLSDRIWINASASAVGCEEASGPLGAYFDIKGDKDALFGTETFEKAEAKMQYLALSCAMQKAGVGEESLGMIFSGDLLNQCVSSAYGLLDYNVLDLRGGTSRGGGFLPVSGEVLRLRDIIT